MSDLRLCSATQIDVEVLIKVLHDADEDEAKTRAALDDKSLHSYAAYDNEELVGAAVVRWSDAEAVDASEIVLLAVAPARRGQETGKWIVAALMDEARRRSVRVLLVGTGSLSLDNIAFYQKCGFRMSHVRRDHFDYIQPPLVVDGVTLRDMIMFEHILKDVGDLSQV